MTYFQGKGRGYNSPQSRIMVGAFSVIIHKCVFFYCLLLEFIFLRLVYWTVSHLSVYILESMNRMHIVTGQTILELMSKVKNLTLPRRVCNLSVYYY